MKNCIFGSVLCALVTCFLAPAAEAQTGIYDRLRLKATNPTIDFAPANVSEDRFRIFVKANGDEFNIDSPGDARIVSFLRNAKQDSLIINQNGSIFGDSVSINGENPRLDFLGSPVWRFERQGEELQIGPVNGGTSLSFGPDATTSHRHFTVKTFFPEVIFESTYWNTTWGMGIGQARDFKIDATQESVFRIRTEAPSNSMNIGVLGVGVGGFGFPGVPGLHVRSTDSGPFQDAAILVENADSTIAAREQLRLRNNGPARLALEDTNLGVTWSLITTSRDEFQIRKNGPGTSNITIRADGTYVFANGGQSKFTVFPDGNAFLRGSLSQNSNRDVKKNINAVDADDVLSKVLELPISTWTYKTEDDGVRHLGPMAQDFHQQFQLGANETSISTLDTSGVALAAIQGLHQRLESKCEKIHALEKSLRDTQKKWEKQQELIEEQQQVVNEMKERMERLEQLLSSQK